MERYEDLLAEMDERLSGGGVMTIEYESLPPRGFFVPDVMRSESANGIGSP
jgi:hypothetical protein